MNYQYCVGGSLIYLWYKIPKSPILIIKAPMLRFQVGGLRSIELEASG